MGHSSFWLAERIELNLRAVTDSEAAQVHGERIAGPASDTLAGLVPVPDDGDAAGLFDRLRKLDVEGLRWDRDTTAAALMALGRDAVPDNLPDTDDLCVRVARRRSACRRRARRSSRVQPVRGTPAHPCNPAGCCDRRRCRLGRDGRA